MMKIYDISQDVFACDVYPGDRAPCRIQERRMEDGELYNLTSLEMCTHNGTHIDAPCHFIAGGDGAEKIPLGNTVGYCYVTEEQNDDIGKEEAVMILASAEKKGKECARRILIKGSGTVTADAAHIFADSGIYLLGVEGQSVGPEDAPMEVHRILLGKKTVLLEGIRLGEVREGVYFLSAAPLSLEGSDGSPCRAVLIDGIADET